jgi:ABC transport system ATP-binding/permease protein
VYGYLDDFLFSSERARSAVKTLSGGERNRLLLARLLARPANVLMFDEPTNDLDLETLEVLEAQLIEFPGTLLIVTHDRSFLDNVVTSTLVFEGDGRVEEYVGGYADWIAQRRAPDAVEKTAAPRRSPATAASRPVKLSYNEQREFERLPDRIAALEAEHAELQARVASPEFYKERSSDIHAWLARLDELAREVDAAYRRWDELDRRTG